MTIFNKNIRKAIFSCLILSGLNAFADNSWQYVGSQNLAISHSISLTVDGNDRPILAYFSDFSPPYGVFVKAFGGIGPTSTNQWEDLNINVANGATPSITYANNSIYVAYQDLSNTTSPKVTVKTLPVATGIWGNLGQTNFAANSDLQCDQQISIGVDQLGAVYVSYVEDYYKIYPGACNNDTNSTYHNYTMYYNSANNSWQQYGSGYFYSNPISGYEGATDGYVLNGYGMDFGNGKVYIGLIDNNSYHPIVASNSSSTSNWTSADLNDKYSNTSYPGLATDANGTPYMVFQDSSNNIIVKKYYGNSWQKVNSMTNSTTSYSSIAIDKNPSSPYYNQPIIAFVDGASNNGISVMRLDASNQWQVIGQRGFAQPIKKYGSNVPFNYTRIAIGNNSIYVALKDSNGNTSVMQFVK